MIRPDARARALGGQSEPAMLKPIHLRQPYAVYFGDLTEALFAKTGLGLVEWRRELCVAQVRREGCCIDVDLPDLKADQLATAGVQSLVLGVAPIGGDFSDAWLDDLCLAAAAGIDIVSGMHRRLRSFPQLAEAAARSGARLLDLRVPPSVLPIGTGAKRTGRRLLTIGTDCAVGKKYTALAIEKEMQSRGWSADFRATGQTGIMIAGSGIPIDAVPSDFIAGAAELLSPDAAMEHWDVIEGQGALSHPSYAGVSLGLLHGSQPDAMVLCHDPSRPAMITSAQGTSFSIETQVQTMELALRHAKRVNADARFVAVSINSSRLTQDQATRTLGQISEETGLLAIDPIRDGAGAIVDALAQQFGS